MAQPQPQLQNSVLFRPAEIERHAKEETDLQALTAKIKDEVSQQLLADLRAQFSAEMLRSSEETRASLLAQINDLKVSHGAKLQWLSTQLDRTVHEASAAAATLRSDLEGEMATLRAENKRAAEDLIRMRAMMEETLLLAKAQLAGERQQAPVGALVQGEAAVLRAEIEKASSCCVQTQDSLKLFRSETEAMCDRLAALESALHELPRTARGVQDELLALRNEIKTQMMDTGQRARQGLESLSTRLNGTDAVVQQLTADTGAAALSLADVERKLDALHRESNENGHRPSHPHEATVAQIANLSDDLERRIRQLESFMAYLEQTTKGGQHPQTPKTASANAGRNSKDGHLHPPHTPRATATAPGDGSMGPPKTPHSLAKLHARRMSVTFASESISETGELGSIALAPLSVGMKLSSLEHDLQLMKLEQSDKLRSLREFDSFSDAVLKASSTQDLRDVLEREAQSSQNWRHEFEQRILAVDEEMTCVRLQVDELYQWLTEQPQLADSDSEAGDSSIFASIESWFD